MPVHKKLFGGIKKLGQIAAPIAGGIFGGPLGAAAGGALGRLLGGGGLKGALGGAAQGFLTGQAGGGGLDGSIAALLGGLGTGQNEQDRKAQQDFINQRIALQKEFLDQAEGNFAARQPARQAGFDVLGRFATGGNTAGEGGVAGDIFQGFLDRKKAGFIGTGNITDEAGVGAGPGKFKPFFDASQEKRGGGGDAVDNKDTQRKLGAFAPSAKKQKAVQRAVERQLGPGSRRPPKKQSTGVTGGRINAPVQGDEV